MTALTKAQAQRAEALQVARAVLLRPDADKLLDLAGWIVDGLRSVVGEVADLDEVAEADEPWTFVFAPSQFAGANWCRDHGVPPRGKRTRIISQAHAIHGHAIRPSDRVVIVGDVDILDRDLRDGMRLAQRAGGSL